MIVNTICEYVRAFKPRRSHARRDTCLHRIRRRLRQTRRSHHLATWHVQHSARLGNRNRRRIGYVPQSYASDIESNITAEQSVLLGLTGTKFGIHPVTKALRDKARKAMDFVGLQDKANYRLSELSGGLRQRVAHDLNMLLPILTGAVYLLDGHPHYAGMNEVLDSHLLTHLYGTTVQVVTTPQGDMFVTPSEDEPENTNIDMHAPEEIAQFHHHSHTTQED